jgi:hydroxyacylglutathione hydrolase
MKTLCSEQVIPSGHVISSLPPSFSIGTGAQVHQVPTAQDNLCWLIEYTPGSVAVVDGPDAESVLAFCRLHDLSITHILNTHTHGDHVGINRDLLARGYTELEIWGSALCADQIPGLTRELHEGDQLKLGLLRGEVWLTEGHLDGHISFIFDGALFCGDTLFGAGCGYLFDGPPQKMYDSLTRLASLPPKTAVCCAHEYTLDNVHFALSVDPKNRALQARASALIPLRAEGRSSLPSTIELERMTNPFMRAGTPSIREVAHRSRSAHRSLTDTDHPLSPVEIFAVIRSLKNLKAYRNRSIDQMLSTI